MSAAKYDIKIEQGATFDMVLTLRDAAGDVMDLTDHSFRGQVRKSYSDLTVQATFQFEVLDQTQPATKGKVRVFIPAAQTTLIKVNKADSEKRTLTPYIYDIESQIPTGSYVFRWLEGTANISPEVTK